jgi:NAD(P)H-nitrite reductase large subunit
MLQQVGRRGKIDFFAAWFHHVSVFVNLVKQSSMNLEALNQRVKHIWYIQRKVDTSRSVDQPKKRLRSKISQINLDHIKKILKIEYVQVARYLL